MHNLFCVASKSYPPIFGVHVELLRARPKVFDKGFQDICTDPPSILSTVMIEQGMLNFGSFIC